MRDPEKQRAARRRHYERNKKAYIKRARERNLLMKEVVRQILWVLKSVPCSDCKGTFSPCAMDFDHVADDKEFAIGSRGRYVSLDDLFTEIEKCEVVCSNCHRIRTWKRQAGLA